MFRTDFVPQVFRKLAASLGVSEDDLATNSNPKPLPFAQGHWLWGQRDAWRSEPTRFPADLALQHGGIVEYRVAHKHFVTVARADLAREMMVTKQPLFQRGLFQKIMGQNLGRMLLTDDGKEWHLRRRFVLPAFSRDIIRGLTAASLAAVDDHCQRWHRLIRQGDNPNIVADTRFLAMDAMYRTLFTATPTAVEVERLASSGRCMRVRTIERSQTLRALFLGWVPALSAKDKLIKKRFDDVLEPRLQEIVENPELHDGPMVRAMLAVANRSDINGEQMKRLLHEEVRGLFMAGYETTADTLAWALYLIAKNPKIARSKTCPCRHCHH